MLRSVPFNPQRPQGVDDRAKPVFVLAQKEKGLKRFRLWHQPHAHARDDPKLDCEKRPSSEGPTPQRSERLQPSRRETRANPVSTQSPVGRTTSNAQAVPQ